MGVANGNSNKRVPYFKKKSALSLVVFLVDYGVMWPDGNLL